MSTHIIMDLEFIKFKCCIQCKDVSPSPSLADGIFQTIPIKRRFCFFYVCLVKSSLHPVARRSCPNLRSLLGKSVLSVTSRISSSTACVTALLKSVGIFHRLSVWVAEHLKPITIPQLFQYLKGVYWAHTLFSGFLATFHFTLVPWNSFLKQTRQPSLFFSMNQ